MNVEQMLWELNAADDFLRHPQWTEGYLASCLVFKNVVVAQAFDSQYSVEIEVWRQMATPSFDTVWSTVTRVEGKSTKGELEAINVLRANIRALRARVLVMPWATGKRAQP